MFGNDNFKIHDIALFSVLFFRTSEFFDRYSVCTVAAVIDRNLSCNGQTLARTISISKARRMITTISSVSLFHL
jgi:hypothetical protein